MILLIGMCASGRSKTPAASPAPTAQAIAAPTPATRTVSGDRVHCRARPAKDATVLATLDRGDTLSVLDQTSAWTKLVHPGGDCWVANALLHG